MLHYKLFLIKLILILSFISSTYTYSNKFYKLDSVCKYATSLYSLNKDIENKIRELGYPLLDYSLVKSTIEEWNRPLPISYLTSPLIISGPSGVGKNRLIKSLLKDYSKFFQKVVTHTTRNPRPDERNGTNYYYITKNEFIKRVNESKFLEWSKVHENYYGVSTDSWVEAQQNGKIPILEIDMQGAKNIKRQAEYFGITPYYLFISPPHIDKLKERLLVRGTESDEEIKLRLENAVKEVQESTEPSLFDKIIINDDLNEASNELFRTVRNWYPTLPPPSKIRMMQRRLKSMIEILKSSHEESNNNQSQS